MVSPDTRGGVATTARMVVLLAAGGICTCGPAHDSPAAPAAAIQAALKNGTPASPAAQPWAAFITLPLQYQPPLPSGVNAFRCTGTLIAPDLVLTAAHCLVCATDAEVQLLGEAPGLPVHQAAPGGLALNPAAYPELPSCQQPNNLLKEDLDALTQWGADVATIKLASPIDPSAVPPKSVLLVPPYGFSPVQDLFGTDVQIVGRGETLPGLGDLAVMNQGLASVDRFVNRGTYHDGCPTFASDPTDFSPLFLVTENAEFLDPPGPGEAAILGGDSGGPVLATIGGVQHVIAINSAGGPNGEFGFHAPTFTVPNASFLWGQLGVFSYPPPFDADGDDVMDTQDNCPLDANTAQIDRDEDGVGDVCDNCAPNDPSNGNYFDRYDGPTTDGSLPNADQAECSDEAASQNLINKSSDFEENGDAAHISLEQYLRGYAPALVLPQVFKCNAHVMYETRRVRTGDRCTPIPCARTEVESEPAPETLLAGPVYCPDHLTVGQCHYEMPSGFAFHPVVAASGAAWGEVGLRHCQCNKAHASELERRLNCGANKLANCGIDAARFNPAPPFEDAFWKKLSLGGQAPAADLLTPAFFWPETGSPGAQVSWQSLADLALLTGQSLPPPPWTIDGDGAIQGGPKLNGIGWAFVPSCGGQPIEQLVDDRGRSYADFASYYLPVDDRFIQSCDCNEVPELAPAFPWEYCAPCRFGVALHWLAVVDPARVLAIGPSRTVDVSQAITPPALALLGSGAQRVPASEPEYRLLQAGLSRRELLVEPATLSVTGRLGIESGQVTGQPLRRIIGEPRSPNGLENADQVFSAALATGEVSASSDTLLSYSARRDQLFALVRAPGDVLRLGFWSGADEQWHDLPLLLAAEQGKDKGEGGDKITLCHVPLSDPDSPHTIEVGSQDAADDHLAHGDTLGRCPIAVGELVAMAFHQEDDTLCLLDRPSGGNVVRLLRIHLLTGRVSVLVDRLLQGSYDVVALSIGYDRELLLGAARHGPGLTRLAHLRVIGEQVLVESRYSNKNKSAFLAGGSVWENRYGVHFLIEGVHGFKPHVVPRAAFVPAPPAEDASPVFP